MVAVAGLIDPTDRGGPGTNIVPLQKYPGRAAAAVFARQLAARLAGSFVFFSPGFDDRIDERLDDGLRVQDSMTAVGQALRGSPDSAVPRHLVGNQLAGGADLTDYDLFHAASWLSFEFYQSGHKGNRGAPCIYSDTPGVRPRRLPRAGADVALPLPGRRLHCQGLSRHPPARGRRSRPSTPKAPMRTSRSSPRTPTPRKESGTPATPAPCPAPSASPSPSRASTGGTIRRSTRTAISRTSPRPTTTWPGWQDSSTEAPGPTSNRAPT